MTVGELKRVISSLPDNTPIYILNEDDCIEIKNAEYTIVYYDEDEIEKEENALLIHFE